MNDRGLLQKPLSLTCAVQKKTTEFPNHCAEPFEFYLGFLKQHIYRYSPHNDVSLNDGQHIRRWSDKIGNTVISRLTSDPANEFFG